jgi:hypothetical protein
MDIVRMYHILLPQLKQMMPTERITRLRNMAWLQAGILMSGSVHLSHAAKKMPGRAKGPSATRRLSRFLANHRLRVRSWYEPLARALLQSAAHTGQVRLIIDGTLIGRHHQLLMVAVAYRRRALPIVWTWVPSKKGHSSGQKQRALLAYVHHLMPAAARVVVLGDSEFTPLQALLTAWGWDYVLRQKGSHLLQSQPGAAWQRCETLVTRPGQCQWLTEVTLTQRYRHRTHFLAYWQRGAERPWLLATSLPTASVTRRLYGRRMWVEEMFGDFKGHGFDLAQSRLQHLQRLSRLTLAVALLYVHLVAFGAAIIKRGQRHLVDRKDRRDLSVFRIGLDALERFLINGKTVKLPLVPYSY